MTVQAGRHGALARVAATAVLLWFAAPAWAGGDCEPRVPGTFTAPNGQTFHWEPGYG